MGIISVMKSIPSAAVKTAGKVGFKLSKNKPQILVFTGVAVATTGFVLAVIGATKLKETTEKNELKLDEANAKKQEALEQNNEQTAIIVAECDKDIRKIKWNSALDLIKLLGIPGLMFIGGMSMSVGGHLILLRRFGQLSSAFATLQQTFEKYRQLNIAEHGEECDRRYRYGITDTEKVSATITDENGKEKKVTCKLPVVDEDRASSMYSFIFSEDTSRKCPRDPVNMISFLRSQEYYWNTWMDGNQKPVTLYMVLNGLGIELDPDDPRNDYIMIAGWRPNGDGDNHIDFGIMRAVNKPALDMLENVCFLNFNCDGNLYYSTRYTKDGRKVC